MHIGISLLQRRSMFFRIGKAGFKIPRYQNTYQLEPIKKFNAELVDKILINVMRSYLIGIKYHPQICIQICQKMSAEVRDQIYRKFYDRYKVVVIMSIVQKLGQGVRIDFSKLWDIERDTYSTHVIETQEFSAIGLVVGLYYE
ncbi:tctex1 domain-containing protein 1-B-like [Harpegnathos saltator]|uniref:tctex1 domain-containing protein 1-B-like n=1 Tax=Harpegnathos saltator TaxID=610380 RepID=UPI000948F8B9|nr:tctex1 domain-containing protein 1-B-like [Harpegnathos saltator]